MASQTPFPPIRDPIADQGQGFGVTLPWNEWFNALTRLLDQAPTRLNVVSLQDQQASISPTDMSAGELTGGLYRVTYYLRISQPATTSSSVAVTIAWTDNAVSPSVTFPAVTGNTDTTVQSETLMLRGDPNAPITYSTAYSSTGATPMQYQLDVTLEQIPE